MLECQARYGPRVACAVPARGGCAGRGGRRRRRARVRLPGPSWRQLLCFVARGKAGVALA